jgi:hypothetical protein
MQVLPVFGKWESIHRSLPFGNGSQKHGFLCAKQLDPKKRQQCYSLRDICTVNGRACRAGDLCWRSIPGLRMTRMQHQKLRVAQTLQRHYYREFILCLFLCLLNVFRAAIWRGPIRVAAKCGW